MVRCPGSEFRPDCRLIRQFDAFLPAPLAQGFIGLGLFEVVPLLKHALLLEQSLETRIGAAAAEDFPDLVALLRHMFFRKP